MTDCDILAAECAGVVKRLVGWIVELLGIDMHAAGADAGLFQKSGQLVRFHVAKIKRKFNTVAAEAGEVAHNAFEVLLQRFTDGIKLNADFHVLHGVTSPFPVISLRCDRGYCAYRPR